MERNEYAAIISEMIDKLEPLHVLDYFCGANVPLAKALKVKCAFKYQAYDPAVPKFASPPLPADVVLCMELGKLDEQDAEDVLDDIRRVTEGVGFLVVADSERPATWWLPRIMVRFDLQTYQVSGENSFYVVVYAQPRAIENLEGEKLA